MKKTALLLGLGIVMVSSLHGVPSEPLKFDIASLKTKKETPETSLKKLMADCPEFESIIKSVKSVLDTLAKKGMHKDYSLVMVMNYEPSAFKNLETAQVIESIDALNQMPGIVTAVNNAAQEITISAMFDKIMLENIADLEQDINETKVSTLDHLYASLKVWTSQVEEALETLKTVEKIDPFLAEQVLQIFNVFQLFAVVEQINAMLFDENQGALSRSYKTITFSLRNEHNNVIEAVSSDLNNIFEQLFGLQKKLSTDTAIAITLDQTIKKLVGVITEHQA